VAVEFAGASEDDLVAVGQEGADLAGGERDGLGSVAGEFEEAAGGGFGWAGDGSGSEDVAYLKVAAVAGVVGYELSGGPVEVLRVASAKHIWVELIFSHCFSYQKYLKFYIEVSVGVIASVMEVWEGLGIAVASSCDGSAEGFESSQGGDPGGDGGGEAFGEEGSQRLVLPGLEIAGGPVVEQAYAEDVVSGFANGNGGSEGVGLTYVKSQLELVVEGSGGGEAGAEFVAGWA
jgi:hypothetical protein